MGPRARGVQTLGQRCPAAILVPASSASSRLRCTVYPHRMRVLPAVLRANLIRLRRNDFTGVVAAAVFPFDRLAGRRIFERLVFGLQGTLAIRRVQRWIVSDQTVAERRKDPSCGGLFRATCQFA